MADRYNAFISYSHHDRVWATWLHSALERFIVPRQIEVERHLPGRTLSPIFKDDNELGASSDLGESIMSAIARSNALIVICSPGARESTWVNREIEAYVEQHTVARVFCVIVDGDISSALPRALAGNNVEPLAVDPRPTGDGKRPALLKLVAGLLGVPYAELQQRELHRRSRRLAWIAAASVAGMVLTSSLGWYALASRIAAEHARQEAELRRNQAEDFIDYMLGDLRQKLEPMGRLDLLSDIGDQASNYFSSLSDEEMTEEMRLRRARAMHQIGDVRFKAGDFESAISAFSAALQEMRALHRLAPDDPDIVYELGQAHYWVGFANWYYKDYDNAAEHWQSYLDHSRSLVERDPDNLDWWTELGWALGNLGTLADDRGDLESSRKYFEESAEIFKRLSAQTHSPALRYEYSSALSWLAKLHRELGQLQVAHETYLMEAQLLRELNSAVDNAHWKYAEVNGLLHLGELELDLGELERSRNTLEQALPKLAGLRALDPGNTHWQFGEAMVHDRLAHALMHLGEFESATVNIGNALETVKELLQVERDNPRWQELELEVTYMNAHLAELAGDDASMDERLDVLLRRAAQYGLLDSVPGMWGLVLQAESTGDADDRMAASKALAHLALTHGDSRNPDLAVPELRALYAQEGMARLEEAARPVESGLMHPDLPFAGNL